MEAIRKAEQHETRDPQAEQRQAMPSRAHRDAGGAWALPVSVMPSFSPRPADDGVGITPGSVGVGRLSALPSPAHLRTGPERRVSRLISLGANTRNGGPQNPAPLLT